MKITIKNVELPVKITRKYKLFKINGNENVRLPRKYDWSILYENQNEHFEDFQIFCLSVAKDLLSSGLVTNETGILKYTEKQSENTLQDIQNLIFMIEDKNKK